MSHTELDRNSPTQYPLSMRLMHWGMAALIIALIIVGLSMVTSLQTWQPTLLTWHKAFGVLAAILVIARLINRVRHQQPQLPSSLPKWQQLAARGSHVLLYTLMILMPVSGYLMHSAAGRSVYLFADLWLPPALAPNLTLYAVFRELHAYSALVLVGVISVHALAALHHGFVRRDGVLKSMLFK